MKGKIRGIKMIRLIFFVISIAASIGFMAIGLTVMGICLALYLVITLTVFIVKKIRNRRGRVVYRDDDVIIRYYD